MKCLEMSMIVCGSAHTCTKMRNWVVGTAGGLLLYYNSFSKVSGSCGLGAFNCKFYASMSTTSLACRCLCMNGPALLRTNPYKTQLLWSCHAYPIRNSICPSSIDARHFCINSCRGCHASTRPAWLLRLTTTTVTIEKQLL